MIRRSELAAFFVADETRMDPEERERRESAARDWTETRQRLSAPSKGKRRPCPWYGSRARTGHFASRCGECGAPIHRAVEDRA